jgi:acetyl-CoA C-acetyltransferase
MADAFIVQAVRTAGGKRNGSLACVHPADLGATVLDALVERSGIDPAAIDDVIVGCVTQAGEQSFAFGRNMVLASSLPMSVPAVTVDRQCGSSQQALHFALQAVMSGTQDIVIAAGTESMTRVPMGSNFRLHAKAGIGEGPWSRKILDQYGVDEFNQFVSAQAIADKYGFDRASMDEYALSSHQRAARAIQAGAFKDEIVPVLCESGIFDRDEGVRADASLEAMSHVKPILEGGSVTAANSSQMTDGASGILVVSEDSLKRFNLAPLARICNMTVSAGDPVLMLEEPIRATIRALSRAGLHLDDIDLFEVNEAFAAIPLAWLAALGANPEKLNVHGGAIALGHPLGATGAKLMTTLIHALRSRGLRYGLQAMCEGGGTANVTIVEAL